MAISIDPLTKIIFVPKADMTVIQTNPTEIRELDLNDFRLEIADLQDNFDGITLDTAVNHTAPVTIGGVQLARVVEIINNYTLTLEDGQYAVNIVGGNSNLADKANVNQVSIRSANSAGLITVTMGSGVLPSDVTDITNSVLAAMILEYGNLFDDQVTEIWRILGLDQANPMTVTPTARNAGSISQTITGDGETTTTVTRDP